jgi:hypothetical protein
VGDTVAALTAAPAELVDFVRRNQKRPSTPAATKPLSLSAKVDRTASRWSAAGLIGRVFLAPEGERNNALNWAAHRIGLDVFHGKAPRPEADAACEELERAGLANGLEFNETTASIVSGYTAGMNGRPSRRGAA